MFGPLKLCLALVMAAFGAHAQEKLKIEGPFAARDGETCVVCNTRVSAEDAAFLVNGQRVAVMQAMQEEFLANPLAYVAKFRPEGMVFSARQEGSATGAHFWLGVFVAAGLLFGGICAQMALMKGLSSWQWFFLGFVFSVPALLALAGRPALQTAPSAPPGIAKIPSTHSPVDCPDCGASNHPSAEECSGCGAKMQPLVSGETSVLRKPLE